jgi:hypothetical protein
VEGPEREDPACRRDGDDNRGAADGKGAEVTGRPPDLSARRW